MERAVDIIAMISLGIICFQDFRSRKISWWTLLSLSAAFIFLSLIRNTFSTVGKDFLFNLGTLALQLIFTWVWLCLRKRALAVFFDVEIGSGDVLFFITAAFLFSPLNYMLFYVCGLLLSLLLFFILKILLKNEWKEIPLAGILTVPLFVFCCWHLVNPSRNFHHDLPLFSFIQFKA